MTTTACPLEGETLRAVLEGRWPESCDAALRDHAAVCERCADLIVVARAVSSDRAVALREARPPSAGLVFRRIELRRRREAARSYRRAMLAVQLGMVAAVAVSAALLLRVAPVASPDWFWWLARLVDPESLASIASVAARWTTPLLLASGAWLTLAPAALYFALSDE